MIKLDLKNFKHESSDEKSTTLRHKSDGHQIILAHKALSPANQEQLKALAQASRMPTDKAEAKQDIERTQMADGGEIAESKKKPKKSNTIVTPSAQSGVEQSNELRKDQRPEHGRVINVDKDEYERRNKMASGGKVQMYANPDDIVKADDPQIPYALSPDTAETPVLDLPPAQDSTMQGVKPAEPMFTPDQMQDRLSGGQGMAGSMQSEPAGQAMAPKEPNSPAVAQALSAPTDAPPKPDELPKAVTAPIDAKQDANAAGMSMGDYAGMLQGGFNKQMAGISDQQTAQMQLGKDQEAALAKNVQAQEQAKSEYKGQYDKLEAERQAHMADIQNGHIDPNKYWTGDANGNGSHSRVASAIGMILAGFNPTSKPNAAIDMLKYQMDQNIRAQEANLNSNQNLLSANLKQFGNLRDATDMTKLMQADIIHNQLLQASAKAQTPFAKAAAEQAAGKLMQEFAPLQQQIAMRQSMMKLADAGNGDPSNTAAAEHMIAYARMTNPEVAKEMESRLIPGVGMAKVPVPETVRQELVAKQSLNSAAQDLMQYSHKHTNIVPGTAEYNYGVSKAMALQQKVREGMLGTVFRESEKPLLEKFVNENPAGAMKSLSTIPQLKAIMDSNNMGLNTLKQSVGLPTQQQQASPEYKTVNGVKYMRGPNGQAIPVK